MAEAIHDAAVLRATITVYVEDEAKYAASITALDSLLARLSAAETERGDLKWSLSATKNVLKAAEARVEALEQRIEGVAALACDLLGAVQPWEMQPPQVRSAAVRLTVALAALPARAALSAGQKEQQ